jgi:hypothetical protein
MDDNFVNKDYTKQLNNLQNGLNDLQRQTDNNYVIAVLLLGMNVVKGFISLCKS